MVFLLLDINEKYSCQIYLWFSSKKLFCLIILKHSQTFKNYFFVSRCSQDKHKIVSDVTVDHVNAFARNMFKQPLFIQTLVQGNIIPDEAKDMFEMICKAFKVRLVNQGIESRKNFN